MGHQSSIQLTRKRRLMRGLWGYKKREIKNEKEIDCDVMHSRYSNESKKKEVTKKEEEKKNPK